MPQFQYKQQQFQQDAVNAVVDVFRGVDFSPLQQRQDRNSLFSDSPAETHVRELPFDFLRSNFFEVLESNTKSVQKKNDLNPDFVFSHEDYLILDTQMETGTGKTFTFINAIFELHKQYQLTHFIVIVPSIAIKEGIKKSFETTRLYFEQLYHQRVEVHEMTPAKSKKGRKSPPSGVMSFVYSQQLTVLIMTSHSFNREDNIINQELEGFYADNARTPMQAIAAKNPVLIIDEPQRVEGTETLKRIKNFAPMFVLRYSATFREGQIKNLVYVLDSYDAFDKKLVKGITVTDYKTSEADSAFVGVRGIFTDNKNKLIAELNVASKTGGAVTVSVQAKGAEDKIDKDYIFNQTENPAYKGLYVESINRTQSTVIFSDGTTVKSGEYRGPKSTNQNIVSEVMLRDTIEKHLRKEESLFMRGIKCISLIFIDRVKDYRNYDGDDEVGELQKQFERIYADCIKRLDKGMPTDYRTYLQQWGATEIHGGYFSGDARSNKAIDAGDINRNNEKSRKLQQEISELILRDKEKVLDPSNKLRFIFAHSALREGWDNPNVFQICKLRSSYSETGIVQEIGRGLRICVNQRLERQDTEIIGSEFSAVNSLDVFTLGNGDFINRLQQELSSRRNPLKGGFSIIDTNILADIYQDDGIQQRQALDIMLDFYAVNCLSDDGIVMDREKLEEVLIKYKLDPQKLLADVPQTPEIIDGRIKRDEVRKYSVSESHYKEFKELWELLHKNVTYEVQYSDDFEKKVVKEINEMPDIEAIYLHKRKGTVTTGEGDFSEGNVQEYIAGQSLTSDLSMRAFLNQLADKTKLPRNTIIRILSQVNEKKFRSMQNNPYKAIQIVVGLINNVVYENIVDNVRYVEQDGLREPKTEITLTDKTFTAQQYLTLADLPEYKENNLWKEIAPYDSVDPEKRISENALADDQITVFAKLPRAVNIPSPMHPKGINPDFAFILRKADGTNQIYFVAEAKPTTDTGALRREEQWRIDFLKKYFTGINADISFSVVSNYDQLLTLFKQSGKNHAR